LIVSAPVIRPPETGTNSPPAAAFKAADTNAVEAALVELSPTVGVGTVGEIGKITESGGLKPSMLVTLSREAMMFLP
jgi:hypothetical protein